MEGDGAEEMMLLMFTGEYVTDYRVTMIGDTYYRLIGWRGCNTQV